MGGAALDHRHRVLFRLSRLSRLRRDLLVTILFALSLDLALGYAGIITLGHAAFFGAGAYTVGMLAFYGIWTEPITSLLLAALVAAVVGFFPGLVLLRTKGLTLLMLTLCTMALLEQAANMAHAYTGGFDGLPSLTIAPVFGVFEFNPLYANTQYLYSLGVLLVCFVFVRTLVYSPFGQSLTGIRENLLRMHAIGSPVRRRLVICYTISAALAGIAGGLWAQTNAYVNLSALGLDRAATVLIVLILGGYGRLYGAFVGAVVYLALEHFLAQIYPTAWQLGLGLLLVAIALFARNGILGLGEALWRRYGARRAARRHDRNPAGDTRALSRHFGALKAVQDIDFKLDAGARHALIGPNGAGKTTFINLLTGVLPPTGGRVLLGGRDITGKAQAERVKLGIARTFQINRLFRGLSVLENVCIAVAERVGAASVDVLSGRQAHRRHRRIDASFWKRSSSPTYARHRVSELPYGRQRLVELAIAHWAEARSAAARRARRRRAERRKPHHSRRHRAAAGRYRRAHHRARHGRGVPLRQARHGDGGRRGVRRRHAAGDRGESAGARGLSRPGRLQGSGHA